MAPTTQWLVEPGNGSPWRGFQIVQRTDTNNDAIIAWCPWRDDALNIARLLRTQEVERAADINAN